MKTAKQYKWANPYEWLEYKSQEWLREPNKLRNELLNLARQTDMDTLQDEYQSDMDEDGYFKAVKA